MTFEEEVAGFLAGKWHMFNAGKAKPAALLTFTSMRLEIKLPKGGPCLMGTWTAHEAPKTRCLISFKVDSFDKGTAADVGFLMADLAGLGGWLAKAISFVGRAVGQIQERKLKEQIRQGIEWHLAVTAWDKTTIQLQAQGAQHSLIWKRA
ncbi:MAG TPA: hypothetical protein VFZ48_03280 [Candidatus Saccharimonadales bacterium]